MTKAKSIFRAPATVPEFNAYLPGQILGKLVDAVNAIDLAQTPEQYHTAFAKFHHQWGNEQQWLLLHFRQPFIAAAMKASITYTEADAVYNGLESTMRDCVNVAKNLRTTQNSYQRERFLREHPCLTACEDEFQLWSATITANISAIDRLAADSIAASNAANGMASLFGGKPESCKIGIVKPLSEKQRKILAALAGRSLPGKELAKEVTGANRTCMSHFLRDEVRPLTESGLIANDRRAGGYYRPDAPPT